MKQSGCVGIHTHFFIVANRQRSDEFKLNSTVDEATVNNQCLNVKINTWFNGAIFPIFSDKDRC